MNSKAIGSILMILGTAVGAGMLALPVVTAYSTYPFSIALLALSWAIMAVGAFCLLKVNFWLPANSNLVTMARATLGLPGEMATWLIYLFLLYSLICAYLSGISDLLQAMIISLGINAPRWLATLLGLTIFGGITYRGIASVDMINRGLMTVKLAAYALLVALISPHIELKNVMAGNQQWHLNSLMVMMTSFGFATIIPSLRVYLQNDQQLLKRIVLWGSLLPLLIYSIWIAVVQGLLPRFGTDSLISMLLSSHTNSDLIVAISNKLNTSSISNITKIFVSICTLTSFLGVSVCLIDFFVDSLHIAQHRQGRLMAWILAYLPPLLIVLITPGIFIKALNYAGILCVLLLAILPILMFLCGRRHYSAL